MKPTFLKNSITAGRKFWSDTLRKQVCTAVAAYMKGKGGVQCDAADALKFAQSTIPVPMRRKLEGSWLEGMLRTEVMQSALADVGIKVFSGCKLALIGKANPGTPIVTKGTLRVTKGTIKIMPAAKVTTTPIIPSSSIPGLDKAKGDLFKAIERAERKLLKLKTTLQQYAKGQINNSAKRHAQVHKAFGKVLPQPTAPTGRKLAVA